jgi:hypothetical protein
MKLRTSLVCIAPCLWSVLHYRYGSIFRRIRLVIGNSGQMEKYTNVDAKPGVLGWCDYWFVCYRKGKQQNNE